VQKNESHFLYLYESSLLDMQIYGDFIYVVNLRENIVLFFKKNLHIFIIGIILRRDSDI